MYRLGTEPRDFSSLVRAYTVQCLVGAGLLLAGGEASETQTKLDISDFGATYVAQVTQASRDEGLGVQRTLG